MSREKRKIDNVFKVFCEGDTEYNYFEEMRRKLKLKISLKPINMKGGGYSNFVDSVRTDSNTNCVAKFIIIDGDKAINDVNEKKQLNNLLEYCIIQNKSARTPHILIVNYPDFEYIACLHVPAFRGNDTDRFIVKELGYRNVDEFKSDSKVYEVLNSNGNSVDVMLDSLNTANCFIVNNCTYNKSMYSISVETTYDWDRLGYKGSNINEFFEIVLGKKSKKKSKKINR